MGAVLMVIAEALAGRWRDLGEGRFGVWYWDVGIRMAGGMDWGAS